MQICYIMIFVMAIHCVDVVEFLSSIVVNDWIHHHFGDIGVMKVILTNINISAKILFNRFKTRFVSIVFTI